MFFLHRDKLYLNFLSKFGEMIHHFAHQVVMGHEKVGIALLKQIIERLQTGLKSLSFFQVHSSCKVFHDGSSCLFIKDLLSGCLYVGLLLDAVEVRSLALRRCSSRHYCFFPFSAI